MSYRPKLNVNQIRAAVLPDLLISIVGPVLIYRLASPHLPAIYALLLAGLLPLIRIAVSLMQSHRLNLMSAFSGLTIALKILMALVLKDARLVLVSDSLVTAVYGILLLASLLTPMPLLMRLIESILVTTPSAQSQQLIKHWQYAGTRSLLSVITAVWGIGLLLECMVRVTLALTLSVEQFLVISPIVRYAFLGVLLLWAFLFARIRRARRHQPPEETARQQVEESSRVGSHHE